MLPHFTNIETATGLGDPIYKNLYECTIILPNALADLYPNSTKVFLENTISVPLPEYPDIPVMTQRFKYSTRKYLAMPDDTSLENLSFKFNMNQNDKKQIETWRIMKAWYDLVWNNRDGSLHNKKGIIGDIIVHCHDKEGNVLRRVTFHNVQINGLKGWDGTVSWDDNAIVEGLEATFVCDYWDDLTY